jgi:hypothetical protein
MQLVEAGYQEFRKKWNLEYPATYAGVRSIRYFETARANASRVALKYELPASVSGDLEFI